MSELEDSLMISRMANDRSTQIMERFGLYPHRRFFHEDVPMEEWRTEQARNREIQPGLLRGAVEDAIKYLFDAESIMHGLPVKNHPYQQVLDDPVKAERMKELISTFNRNLLEVFGRGDSPDRVLRHHEMRRGVAEYLDKYDSPSIKPFRGDPEYEAWLEDFWNRAVPGRVPLS